MVYEALIEDDRRTNAFGLLMSLNMLIERPGTLNTGADCCGGMREAGFTQPTWNTYSARFHGGWHQIVGTQ